MQIRYSNTYQRKIDPTPIEHYAKFDNTLGIYYIEDDCCVDKHHPHLIRETNLKFLKILHDCDIFFMDHHQKKIVWKHSINRKDINRIIAGIETCYRYGWFFDRDLHEDNFEHFGIVSPIIAFDQLSKESFIAENQHKFANKEEREAFLKDRSKLFCLYIFLRRCAILYRDTEYKKPLDLLLTFLSDKKNFDSFKNQSLRVKPIFFNGDYWGTGLHEWLTCKSTIDALRRTAGMEANGEPCIKPIAGQLSLKGKNTQNFIFSEFNWTDFQFSIRTPTNHIIFPHNLNGHPGAVYESIVLAKERTNSKAPRTKGEASKTVWEGKFHELINDKFTQATSISQYMYEIASLYESYILHDKTTVSYITPQPYYFSDGTNTNNYDQVRFFQKKLKKPHDAMHIWLRDMLNQVDLNKLCHDDKMTCSYSDSSILPINKILEKVNPLPTSFRY